MSFREPVALLGLALIPLVVLAYLSLQGRRRRAAAAFANPALVPNLVTATPGWKRHLPFLLVLPALIALVIALARPERTVAAPQRQATVVMVTDTSGSMNADDVEPTRLVAAVKAARTLADRLPKTFRLGLITFADYAEQQAAPSVDREPVEAALDRLQAVGGTAMSPALERAVQAARTPVPAPGGPRRLPATIVLLSDGKDTTGRDPLNGARAARRAGITVNTVALGTPQGEIELTDQFGFPQRLSVPPDPRTLRQIARITGGRFFEARDAGKLESAYRKLGTRIGSRDRKEEVTVAFAGGALVLLVVAGGLSLAWFGRVP